MNYNVWNMIKEIHFLPENYKFVTSSNARNNEITHLNKVNIFVGPNNSGKSRLIRELLRRNYNSSIKGSKSQSGNATIFNEVYRNLVNPLEQHDAILSNSISLLKNRVRGNADEKNQALVALSSAVDNLETGSQIRGSVRNIFNEAIVKFGQDFVSYIKFYDYKALYIPILRGLRPITRIDPISPNTSQTSPYTDFNCYEDRIIFDHFIVDNSIKASILGLNHNNQYEEVKTNKQYFKESYTFDLFTGLDLYYEIKNMLLGTHEQRRFVRDFETFLQKNFFENQAITLTPNINDDVLYIKIGEAEERSIYNIGDGIQSIIITTFPLFRYKNDKLLLFIEEPELTLHPGLQRKLLNTYCSSDFPNLQVFLTTHSNHFLDLTLDHKNSCSIYSFERKSDEDFQIKNVTPNKNILELIGARSSSVFLSNCVIWVEGVSDRLYIREFLKLYMKNSENIFFEEDKHYSIIEYGGGNIVHFNFDIPDDEEVTINVDSITKNNFIVADNDGKEYQGDIKQGEREKSKRLKIYNDKFSPNVFTKHREIENLIPFKVYRAYFEAINDDNNNRKWQYNANKGNETKFKESFNNKSIGELIKRHFIELKNDEDKSKYYMNKDITSIGKEKKDIAFEVIEIMRKIELAFEELPELTQEMTKNIYNFIKTNNSE